MNFIEFQTEKGDSILPLFINIERIAYFEPHPTIDDSTQIVLVGGKNLIVKNSFDIVKLKLGLEKP